MHSQPLTRRDRQRATPGQPLGSRPRRGRFIWPSLLVLVAAGPREQVPPKPGPITLRASATSASRDTLIYTLTWPRDSGANNYDLTWSVGATDGVWTYLKDSTACCLNPINGPLPRLRTTSGTYVRSWLVAIPWDSATFTVQLVAKNNTLASPPYSTSWTIRRAPGIPGPIFVDSSLIPPAATQLILCRVDPATQARYGIVKLDVRPQGLAWRPHMTQQFCCFATLANGRRVKLKDSWNNAYCEAQYQQFLAEVPA